MNCDYDYSAVASAEEAVQCSEIMAQAFVVDAAEELSYLHQVGLDQVRVVRQGHELLGGLALLPMGQWFGGCRVAMTGVASVAIAPHARGRGVASLLMASVVRELAAQGVALTTLYPAVQALYGKVGYGLGGSRYTWKVATHQIQVPHPPLPYKPLSLQEVNPSWPQLQQQMGAVTAGRLDRHPLLWQRLLQPPGPGSVFAYGIGSGSMAQGYLITYQERTAQGTTLTIRDWAAPSLAARQTLWGLLHQQRAQISTIRWAGGAVDPLALVLPEQHAQSIDQDQWMVRILNLQQAMTQRGYPSGLEGELHLAVTDELLPHNHGNFILRVHRGKGELRPGGSGALALNIRHLAPLFTGLQTAQELHALGLLQATPETVAWASALFAGAAPSMPDFF